jgi:hypothetical protein
MTEKRRAELEASRQRAELADQQKALQSAIVDGVQRIQAALSRPPSDTNAVAEPQMVMAGKAAGKAPGKAAGKGRKLRLR